MMSGPPAGGPPSYAPPPGAPPSHAKPPSTPGTPGNGGPPPPGPPPGGVPPQLKTPSISKPANLTGNIGRPNLNVNITNTEPVPAPLFSPIARQVAQDGLPRPTKSPRVLVRPRAVNTSKNKKELADAGKLAAIGLTEPVSPLTPSKGVLEKRLTQFYQENCPSKIEEVQKITTAFEGKEDELNWHLFQKYRKSLHSPSGRRPPEYMPLQLHLVAFYKQYNPSMLQKREELDAIVKVYAGKEMELNDRLQKKYGADLNSLII